MGDFKEHGVLIYMNTDLYVAFIRLQADKGLGRAYAGLLPFTEGMYHLGYISKEIYEANVKKYSEPLPTREPSTPKQLAERRRLEQKDKYFRQVLDQWETHKDLKWRSGKLADAEKFKDKLESARQLLDLREKPVVEGVGGHRT
jgi:hypothetical protein